MLFANIVFKPSILFSNSEPVGINPSAVGFAGWFDGHKSYFGTNPLALSQGVALSCILVFLAVGTVGEAALAVGHTHTQPNVLVDAGLLVNLVNLCGVESGNGSDLLGGAFVCRLTGDELQQELVSNALECQGKIVESHHQQSSHLVVGL